MKIEIKEEDLSISYMTERLLIESELHMDPESELSSKDNVVLFINKCLIEMPKINSLEKECYNKFCAYQEELSSKSLELTRHPSCVELAEQVSEISENERKASLFHDQLFNNYEDLKRVVMELMMKHNLTVS